MHEAYTLFPPTKIDVQIESICAYDNNVLLGTRQGHLLMYSLRPHVTENKTEPQLLQYDKNFSKKAIVQIEVIPEYKLLFSLSDSIINVNDISRSHFPNVHTALKTKGATTFALDVKRSQSMTGEMALVVRLCVAVKRRLQFYYWKNQNLLEFAKDIELKDIPKMLSWSLNYVCIGFRTEYVIYDISKETPEKKDLFPTSSSRNVEPCISIVDSKYFAVAKDEFVITVNPEASFSVENKNDFEIVKAIKDMSGASILDTDNTKQSQTISWSEPVQMLVWDEPYAVGLINDKIEIRVFDSVGTTRDNLIQVIPNLQRARFLISGKQGLLFVASVSHLWCIQAVDVAKQTEHLLQEKNFQLALQLTNISDESEEQKTEKIHQIQYQYACDLFLNKKFRESMAEFQKLKTDPMKVIALFPFLLPGESDKKSKLTDKDLENGLLALIDYLTHTRYAIKGELSGPTAGKTPTFGEDSKALLPIIDTTLLKCYLQTNDSFVAPLLRLGHCHLKESEKVLIEHNKFGELKILYETKGDHNRALQLLKTQANVRKSSLCGHEHTINYLQALGSAHKNLIFEFSGWVLDDFPEDGLRIFTEDMHEVENLPRAEVLDFLLKHHKSLVIAYLEHIIFTWNEAKAIFHDILIQQYREKVFEYKDHGDSDQKKVLFEKFRSKLLNFLTTSNRYNAEKVLVEFPYNDLFEERAIILGRLGKHEKVLAIYVQILGNFDKAIEYCDRTYTPDDPKCADVYVSLIRTIMTPPKEPPYSDVKLHPRCLTPDIETVLDILENNAKKISPHAVLQILPDDISVARLRKFLEIALHHQLEKKRKTQILKGLYYAEHLQIQEEKMMCESKNFLVSELSCCLVCKKKFSNENAFVRLPGDSDKIIHYKCMENVG